MKRFIQISFLSLLFLFSVGLSTMAFAGTWDLSDGNITISSNGTSNIIKQGEDVQGVIESSKTVITTTTKTGNTVTVDSQGGKVEFTMKNLNVEAEDTFLEINPDASSETNEVIACFEGTNTIIVPQNSGILTVDTPLTLKGVNGGSLSVSSCYGIAYGLKAYSTTTSMPLTVSNLTLYSSYSDTDTGGAIFFDGDNGKADTQEMSLLIDNSDVTLESKSYEGHAISAWPNFDVENTDLTISMKNSNAKLIGKGQASGKMSLPIFALVPVTLELTGCEITDPVGGYLGELDPEFPLQVIVDKDGMFVTSAEIKKTLSLSLSSVSATAITYGQTLKDSAITGTAKLGDETVTGTWSWKDGSIKPEISDSQNTEYTVIFTPDSKYEKLNATETTVKITVNEAKGAGTSDKELTNSEKKSTDKEASDKEIKTGDSNDPTIYLLLLTLSLAGATKTLISRRKTSHRK